MTSRLDTSPQARLLALAQSLSLSKEDYDTALRESAGNLKQAEVLLTNRAARKPTAPARSPEERINKAATVLARTPDALDILTVSLSKCLNEPLNEKFRKVNTQSGVFKERVMKSAGTAAIELSLIHI